jgi:hypothetical protein
MAESSFDSRKRSRDSDSDASDSLGFQGGAFDEELTELSGEFDAESQDSESSLGNLHKGGAAETSGRDGLRAPAVHHYDERGERLPGEQRLIRSA